METAEQLKSLGFTGYEARAYLALLACQPASAYEVAKQAGLPTSKIYETVARLAERGVLQASEDESGSQHYHALSPSDLMDSIRNQVIADTDRLLPELQKIPAGDSGNHVWPLTGRSQVESRVLEVVTSAFDTILVSLWPEELEWSAEALRSAETRGVRIALVHFGEPQISIGATYHHPVERTLYAEKGGRGLTVVADGKQVAIANFWANGDIEGSWSRNPSFVTVAEDYVKHDVYITKVTRFLGPEVTRRFGEDYSQLRDVFNAEA